ncbi:nicolin-1 isoform X3 [Labeo rohita]|uniref:nicolin-1 isoform X3 n=1 Tax=Labeo rohita TaxID=84645 RepID=UPI0021E29C01|nr:nicolin-1 isoform X3 [Labeo rohita]
MYDMIKQHRHVIRSIMSAKAVSCTIKSPVALQIGDAVSDSSRPGVYITDINLAEPVNIQEISFKNYYAAYLTVRLQRREDGSAKWVTCLRNYCLMSNPHAEAGSHDYFSIYRQQDSERDVPVWLSTLTPVDEPLDLNGLPDPETVSSSIQQMWALTEIMQASQTAASIGRFDVEGSYDVKLLSYT